MSTYGEDLVNRLIKELPSKQYYCCREPHIANAKSAFKNPDFVIVGARLGVIVLEVKDWVEIGQLTQHSAEIKRCNGEIVQENNPLLTAREYALNLARRFQQREDLLRQHQGKKKLKFPWMYAAVLPNIESQFIEKAVRQGIWDKGCVLGKNELKSSTFEQALKAIPLVWQLQDELGATTLQAIFDVLEPKLDLRIQLDQETLNDVRATVDDRLIVYNKQGQDVGVLTVPQEAVVKEPIRNKQTLLSGFDEFLTQETIEAAENSTVRLVRGVAGSGKSLVLMRRAQYLAESHPDINILVVAFNVDLISDLKSRIPNASQLDVQNFHKICSKVLGNKWRSPSEIEGWLRAKMEPLIFENDLTVEFVAAEIEWRKEMNLFDDAAYLKAARIGRGRALGLTKRNVISVIFRAYLEFQHSNSMIDWADVPLLALAELVDAHRMYQHYDVILIDEAQDFAPSWVALMKKLLKPGGTLFMCDDPTQGLFRTFSWKQKGVEVAGRTLVLRVPFRCTREITEAAHSIIRADALLNESKEIVKPDFETFTLASGNKPELRCNRDHDSEIKVVESAALQHLASGVLGTQIAILCHNKRFVKYWAHLRVKGVYVESFDKMKGLEFQCVIVPHLHTAFDLHGSEKDAAFVAEKRRRVFTAMTRARQDLVLSYQDQLPEELTPILPYVQQDI